jgi:hypothetical protein
MLSRQQHNCLSIYEAMSSHIDAKSASSLSQPRKIFVRWDLGSRVSLAISQCARLLTAVSRVIVMASTKAYYSQTNKSNSKSRRMDMRIAMYDLKHFNG